MGFSIGSLLSAVAPLVGGALFGPAGAAIGGAIGAGFRPQQASFIGPTARRVIGATGVLATGAAIFGPGNGPRTVKDVLDRAREYTGAPVSSRKIRDAARHCSIAIAASMFGISESDVCYIVISTGRRRARGISAADLRRTRSTIRKVHGIQHDLRALSPPARRAPRRAPHHHHH